MSLRTDQIESWLESADDYETGDWRPTKESFEWLCKLALKGLASRPGTLPSGWLAVPVTPTIVMHNACALSGLYEVPKLVLDDDGYVRLVHAPPDWSRVWRVMVEASPSLPQPRAGEPK